MYYFHTFLLICPSGPLARTHTENCGSGCCVVWTQRTPLCCPHLERCWRCGGRASGCQCHAGSSWRSELRTCRGWGWRCCWWRPGLRRWRPWCSWHSQDYLLRRGRRHQWPGWPTRGCFLCDEASSKWQTQPPHWRSGLWTCAWTWRSSEWYDCIGSHSRPRGWWRVVRSPQESPTADTPAPGFQSCTAGTDSAPLHPPPLQPELVWQGCWTRMLLSTEPAGLYSKLFSSSSQQRQRDNAQPQTAPRSWE